MPPGNTRTREMPRTRKSWLPYNRRDLLVHLLRDKARIFSSCQRPWDPAVVSLASVLPRETEHKPPHQRFQSHRLLAYRNYELLVPCWSTRQSCPFPHQKSDFLLSKTTNASILPL